MRTFLQKEWIWQEHVGQALIYEQRYQYWREFDNSQ